MTSIKNSIQDPVKVKRGRFCFKLMASAQFLKLQYLANQSDLHNHSVLKQQLQNSRVEACPQPVP